MLRQNVAATLLNIVCKSLNSMKSYDKTNMKSFHNYRSSLTLNMEGYLSKKSIHINELFVHAIALALW